MGQAVIHSEKQLKGTRSSVLKAAADGNRPGVLTGTPGFYPHHRERTQESVFTKEKGEEAVSYTVGKSQRWLFQA